MGILLAGALFLLSAALSSTFALKVSARVWYEVEYAFVVIGLFAILTALSQVSADSRQTEALAQVQRAEQVFGSVLYTMERRMETCGVWWNVVLDQTNKNPPACSEPHPKYADKTCKDVCRAGHLLSQYRSRPIDTEIEKWETIRSTVCPSEDKTDHGARGLTELDPLCDDTIEFIYALKKAKNALSDADAYNRVLSSPVALIVAQMLLGLILGVEFGKLHAKRREERL